MEIDKTLPYQILGETIGIHPVINEYHEILHRTHTG